ncbi:diguanylate cyclase domain protein [Cetobacterium somerae ATCC BAA-474]|uniref:Diguanylate cyclase domain protein n=1 Tax=Cetobacterium somerae ATCC BAA-474 TaxID=1319815 RepID=U7V870_9FUSO|nr:bifunctional diguanylate cyclase/phosphodiesterase [Cetobacterium somerae]ERT67907.1 diguanylate cyclase domain protein [Cetobacterium somerae ATCC BAA-474]
MKENLAIVASSLFTAMSAVLLFKTVDKEVVRDEIFDPLTGFFNRSEYNRFCLKNNLKTGVAILIDLDNFKEVNDTYGHHIGDKVLVEYASILKKVFRDEFGENNIFRISGDEFYCFLKNTEYNNILKILKTRLKESVEEIYVLIQPKVSLDDPSQIVGAEVLARWKNKILGEIYPNEFIPIAEELKIIDTIDFKVAEEAIKISKEWVATGKVKDDFVISFNFSMLTLEKKDVVERVLKLLKKYSLNGKNIEIELTESIFSSDLKELMEKIKKLRDNKINISLDDFTAGHSTAAILPILDIQTVKFDRTLLESVSKSKKGKIMYESLIKVIKSLNLKMVSEGIETQEELEFLKKNGISVGQGYLFSKPISKKLFFENKN